MPRTATTFLQRNVFPELPHFRYFGPPYTQINESFNRMLFEDESTFDNTAWKSEVASLPGENILISNENFVGQSLYWHFGNRTRIANRLHSAMPDATILLFLRNQTDLLRSLYLLSLQDTEIKTMREYFVGDTKTYQLENYLSQPAVDLYDYAPFDTYHAKERLRGFDYLPLIELYQSLFPRVEVLLYEDFKADPAKTFKDLSNIFEVDFGSTLTERWKSAPVINSSTGLTQARSLRLLNRWRNVLYKTSAGRAFYVRAKRFILKKTPQGKRIDWPDAEWAVLSEYYRNRNIELDNRMPSLGLKRHGEKYLLE